MTNDQATALTLAHEALQLQHPTRNTSAAVRKEQAIAAIDQALADRARQAPAPVEVSRLGVLAHNVSEMCKGALRIPNMPWPDAGAHGLDAYCRAVHRSFCDLRFKLIDIMREAEAHLAPSPAPAASKGAEAWPKTMYAAFGITGTAPSEPEAQSRCTNCDDTGQVTSITGDWHGRCHCEAGRTAPPLFATTGVCPQTICTADATRPAASMEVQGLTREERGAPAVDDHHDVWSRARAVSSPAKG